MIFKKSIDKFKEIFWLPAILLHLVLLVNTKFTLWPEMVVYPYLINNGFLIYKDVINPYPPFLPLALSIIGRYFGYQHHPYLVVTWTLIMLIDILLFTLTYKIAKSYYAAIFALAFFMILSIPFGINGLWFDLVQTPIIIISVYYFFDYLKQKNVSNLKKSFYFLIAAIFIKQQVFWLLIFYLGILFVQYKSKFKILIKNLILPFLFFCTLSAIHIFYFLSLGTLGEFLRSSFFQPFLGGAILPGYLSLPTFKQFAVLALPFLLVLCFSILSKEKMIITRFLLLPLILFAYPRFDYFHLITYIACSSIFIGLGIVNIKKFGVFPVVLFTGALVILSIFTLKYYRNNWGFFVRFFEQDVLSAASLLTQIMPQKSTVYIQNGPDQLYSISGMLPVKPWADEFPWYLENSNLQEEILSSIETQKPQFLIFKPYDEGGKHALGSYRPVKIADHLDNNYVNLVQINDSLWLKVKK